VCVYTHTHTYTYIYIRIICIYTYIHIPHARAQLCRPWQKFSKVNALVYLQKSTRQLACENRNRCRSGTQIYFRRKMRKFGAAKVRGASQARGRYCTGTGCPCTGCPRPSQASAALRQWRRPPRCWSRLARILKSYCPSALPIQSYYRD
jgi:hypothetical protein